jgi:hypothetical protein
VKQAVTGSVAPRTSSFYWNDLGFGDDLKMPVKVPVWEALPVQWTIYWILFNAIMKFNTDQHRDELLVKILSALGRSVEISSGQLCKQVVSVCVSLGIQMFEFNDIVSECVDNHLFATVRLKSSRSSVSLSSMSSNSVDSRSEES